MRLLKKNAIPMLVAGLLVFLITGKAQAQNVQFDCKTSGIAGEIEVLSLNSSCKPVNVDSSIAGIQELANLAQDIFFNRFYGETGSSCFQDSTDSSLRCNLGGTSDPIKLSCTGYNSTTGESSCSLYSPDNPDLANIVSMRCLTTSFDADEKPVGSCEFKLDKAPIIQKMTDTGKLTSLTGNQNAINGAFWTCLNRVSNNASLQAQCDEILSKLTTDPDGVADQLIELFRAVTPTNTDLSLDLSAANIHSTVNNIRTRLTQLRNNQASNSLNLHYFDGQQWLDANTLLAQNNLSMNDASPEKTAKNMSEYGRLGLFLNGSAIKSRQDGSSSEGNHEADTTIATMGMDYRFTDNLIAGVGLNITRSQAEYGRNAGKLDTDNTAIILYGSYYLNNWYIDASLNYAQDSYEQQRNIDCSGCPVAFIQSYSASFDGTQTVLSVGTGYQWQQNALGITPFIQLNQARLNTDAYAEDASSPGAGSNFALAIGEQKRDVSSLKAGANLQYAFSTDSGVIIPLISLQGVHELEDNASIVTGHFVGNISTDASFNLATNDVDTSYFLAATGLSFQLKNGNSGFIHIQSTQGFANLEQMQYTAGWRWEI